MKKKTKKTKKNNKQNKQNKQNNKNQKGGVEHMSGLDPEIAKREKEKKKKQLLLKTLVRLIMAKQKKTQQNKLKFGK